MSGSVAPSLQRPPEDRLLKELAAFTCRAPQQLESAVQQAAKAALVDTLAVGLGALTHPAAKIARRYARHLRVQDGARLWGTGTLVPAETAALVNGVPVRGYDYNDLYLGRRGGGHPSDMIPGLVALAEWRGIEGARLLGAIALGYEVALDLCDVIDLGPGGWDYPNTIAIGATCGMARLLNLSEAQTREALSITVIPHFCSGEVESNDLNARDDLTMWKRFNGSDAIRQSVYASLLAEAGAEGAVRPFEGTMGLLSKVHVSENELAELFDRLQTTRRLSRVTQNTYKRWPVGSRGQSAIQASLEARRAVPDVWAAREVRVLTDEAVYDHLVRQRADPWRPTSRETADHALPYIVATAVLDGFVKVESFDPERVLDPRRSQFLVEKVKVAASPELSKGGKAGFLTRVEIVDGEGRAHVGEAKAPPGHALNPFTEADQEAKFHDNVDALFGASRVSEIVAAVRRIDTLADVRELVSLLVVPEPASLD